MPVILLAIILTTFLCLTYLILTKSLYKINLTAVNNSNKLKISIIIPFKNEEKNLPQLVNSLRSTDYPTENFEVIFVDDNSSDNSIEIIKSCSLSNFKVLKATDKKIAGKKGALEIGIQYANFDIIAITDADCIIEKDWLKSISNKISQVNDLVFGYSPFLVGSSLISKISSYENLKNFILYFSSVELGFPFGATARSLAFRKSVYLEVNGYNNTTETLSGDDDLFIRECVKKNFKIGYFFDKNSFVYSYPSESIKEYLSRKSRHLKTSHHYLFKHKLILGFWYSANFLSLISVLLVPLSVIFFLPFITKILFDVAIMILVKKKLHHSFKFYQVILLEIFYQILIPINFINSFLSKDNWNKS